MNVIENGFLNEFRQAQANLLANQGAGRGNTFAYFGTGSGTQPLPILLGYFSGIPAASAGDPALYTFGPVQQRSPTRCVECQLRKPGWVSHNTSEQLRG